MRIMSVQNSVAHKSLDVRYPQHWYRSADIKVFEKKLENTKFVDVVIDSHGLAIKEKMTDILHRIQSFSLLLLENAVGINVVGQEEPAYKFVYNDLDEAKSAWRNLSGKSCSNGLEEYTNLALLLDKNFSSKNGD